MNKIIECMPNFSEGRDTAVIRQITDAIVSVRGVRLLDVDPGESTNRTVVTFVGGPEPVKEAAFRAARKAAELIDMTQQLTLRVEIYDQRENRTLWVRESMMVDGEYTPPAEGDGRKKALDKLVTDIVDGAQSQW